MGTSEQGTLELRNSIKYRCSADLRGVRPLAIELRLSDFWCYDKSAFGFMIYL